MFHGKKNKGNVTNTFPFSFAQEATFSNWACKVKIKKGIRKRKVESRCVNRVSKSEPNFTFDKEASQKNPLAASPK